MASSFTFRGLRVCLWLATGALLLLTAVAIPAHAQDFQWIRQFGSISDDWALGIAGDASGVYIVGYTGGTLPGQTRAGDWDAYVHKYDVNGNELWTRQFGTYGPDFATGVAVDASGVYVVGGTFDLLPGQTGYAGTYLRKYDSNGNELWTRQFGTPYSDGASGVALDATGVYVVGSTQTMAGYYDAFVHKYDSNGNELWTRQFGTANEDYARGVAVDATGVYVVGEAGSTLSGQTCYGCAFVRKYDLDGNELWTRQFGNADTVLVYLVHAYGVAVDASAIYVVGGTWGSLPGQTNSGYSDAFVRKYNKSSGSVVWTRQFGTRSFDEARGVAVDATGVYVVGEAGSEGGYTDAFVRMYELDGNELRTHQFGSAVTDYARGVAVDATGVYVIGDGLLPGQTSAGQQDAFVVKITVNATVDLPPAAVSVTPSSGSGSSQNFSLLYSDLNGFADLNLMVTMFNNTFGMANGCVTFYVRAANQLFLMNDAGTATLGPATVGEAGTLSNSQCSVDLGDSSALTSWRNLTLNLALSFTAAFGGTKAVQMIAVDNAGLNSGWQMRGTWAVSGSPPSAVSITPSSGGGANQTFALLYSDPNGFNDLNFVVTMVHSTFGFANGCVTFYFPAANQLFLVNDSGTGTVGPRPVGTPGTLQNSQCMVNLWSSSVSTSETNLTLNLTLSFAPGFAGTKAVLMIALDNAGLNSGWQMRGTWTVP
ncbi:MAG: hypothetical protein HY647_06185 [Acidobacteria bacterium]|nr:hypothetical protein [Acidobacteriota bacterium]